MQAVVYMARVRFYLGSRLGIKTHLNGINATGFMDLNYILSRSIKVGTLLLASSICH